MATKRCKQCRLTKPTSEFRKRRSTSTELRDLCRRCENDKYKENRPEHQMRRKYGITPEDYVDMHDTQQGRCMICKSQERAVDRNGDLKRLSVDHDHETGQLRDLLCHACNLGLGLFKDDPKLLLEAASYIQRHRLDFMNGEA